MGALQRLAADEYRTSTLFKMLDRCVLLGVDIPKQGLQLAPHRCAMFLPWKKVAKVWLGGVGLKGDLAWAWACSFTP